LKKAAIIPAILILALSLTAQVGTGNVQGRIVTKEGKPLAGVKVILSRPPLADQKTTTGPAGSYRFPSVFPGPDYSVTTDLADYKTAVRSGVFVAVGGSATVDLVLEPGKPEEQAVAAGSLPAIDRKKMTAGAQFGWPELQTLPTTRDPWAIVALVPSVLLDRENVGGNESGRQPAVVAKGDASNGANNVWQIDGIDVTDPVAVGTSAVNFDFDAIDTIAVTTGGAADVTQQTGGVSVNMIGRRGGNKVGATARFYLTDEAFQGSNLINTLQDAGVAGTNRIEHVRDYGVSLGGPVVKNRIWLWGAYGSQDIYSNTIYNAPDRTLFSSFNFKLDARPFAGNQFEAYFMASSRERYGDNAEVFKPEGDHVYGRHKMGNPVFKIQDTQRFGDNLYLSLKYTRSRTGALTVPMVDENLLSPVVWDVAEATYVPFSPAFSRSWDSSSIDRRKKSFQVLGGLYKDSLFGMAHEFKAGLEFTDKGSASQSGYIHNFRITRNFVDPLIDLGEGLVVPPADYQRFELGRSNAEVLLGKQTSGYLQDTVTKGRVTVNLGLRYDLQRPSRGAASLKTLTAATAWTDIVDTKAMSAVATYFPSIDVSAFKSRYEWSTWSPRIGLSWDIKGTGRTVLKLTLAQYGDVMPNGYGTTAPLGLDGGFGFWWKDADADNKAELGEIYWKYSSVHGETPNRLYALFNADGLLTEAAIAALAGGFESDAYLAGNYWDYDWANNDAVDYNNITTFYRSDVDPAAKNVKSSPRTREITLGLEREVTPDLTASAIATFRRSDNFDWAKLYYPADVFPSTPDLVVDGTSDWYEAAGTVPDTITVGEGTSAVTYDLLDAGGRTWYLPIATFPGETPYRMVDKTNAFRTYLGLELSLNKRLARRWFMNASVTLQDQRYHWKDSAVDPTNQWALDGKAYGNWGASYDGKASVLMYARWMAKLSGLYQLPWGFNVSATLTAREGWKVPNYVGLAYADSESWPGLYRSSVVYLQPLSKDSLPVFHNLTFRLEKSVKLGAGRVYLMADVFNVLNSDIVNRAYDAYLGTYYVDTEVFVANPQSRRYSEILNPRIFRLGLRFEF
jgi:hypothetical protein